MSINVNIIITIINIIPYIYRLTLSKFMHILKFSTVDFRPVAPFIKQRRGKNFFTDCFSNISDYFIKHVSQNTVQRRQRIPLPALNKLLMMMPNPVQNSTLLWTTPCGNVCGIYLYCLLNSLYSISAKADITALYLLLFSNRLVNASVCST